MSTRIDAPRIRDREHARQVEAWAKRHPDDSRHAAVVDELLAYDWREHADPPLSDHARLEVAAAFRRGRPLEPGEPVPGCPCVVCTGIAVVPTRPKRQERHDHVLPALPVDAARAVGIIEVAAMLGIEHRRGWALCPFHADSSPSLHLNDRKNAAFCNVCGSSWDPIALLMDYRHIEFVDAVRELARANTGLHGEALERAVASSTHAAEFGL